MNKRLKLLIAFGATLLVVLLLLRADSYSAARFISLFSSEPKYDGVKFSYWMNHLRWKGSGFNPDAEQAIRAMGTNTLPYLVEWIQRPNNSHSGDYSDPQKARIAFELLGVEAKPAIPDLIKIIGRLDERSDPHLVWNYPVQALVNLGRDAVPLLADKLMEMLANTNQQIRAGSNSLAAGNNNAHETYNYGGVFEVLAEMGTNAEAAMPALVSIASSDLPVGMLDYITLAAVGQNHPDIVAPILVNKFKSNPAERAEIAQAMAVFGTNQADAFLLPIVAAITNQAPTNDWNQITIGQALAKIGANNPDLVLPALFQIYTNSNLYGRSHLAESLASFKGRARGIVPLLMADSWRENSPNDNRWRINLCLAAKTIAPDMPNTLAPLYKDLELNNVMIRNDTIRELAKLGTNGMEAMPVLLKPSNYDHNETYRTIRAIGMASDDVIAELGENLASKDALIADRSLKALKVLAGRYQPAFAMLVKKVYYPQIPDAFRKIVRTELWHLYFEERLYGHHVSKSFENCLENNDAEVRLGALLLMKGFVGFEAPKAKVKQMAENDPDPKVRQQANEFLQMPEAIDEPPNSPRRHLN